jgi:hypothetical protein
MGGSGRTVAIIHETLGINPVVAWLVCVDGKRRAADYAFSTGTTR